MQTLRTPLLTVALLVLAALTVHGQTPVIAGQSTLAFDHSAGDTTGYELCVDTVSGPTCTPVTVQPAPSGDAEQVYRFTAPASLPRGPRVLTVRPRWAGGAGPASDDVTFRVVVQPGKPGPVRPEA